MVKVGLTGGIGVGKSYIGSILASLGCYVFDSDKIAREVVAIGTPGYQAVVAEFGPQVLAADGQLDRERLGQIVFSDPTRRTKLNQLLHPLIIAEQNRQLQIVAEQDSQAIAIVDAALLIETKSYRRFDKLIVVFCDDAIQLARVMERDQLPETAARARINAQMSSSEKRQYADYEIDTSLGFEDTYRQTQSLYQALLAYARSQAETAPLTP
jgi:dephospho-CoA kinase